MDRKKTEVKRARKSRRQQERILEDINRFRQVHDQGYKSGLSDGWARAGLKKFWIGLLLGLTVGAVAIVLLTGVLLDEMPFG